MDYMKNLEHLILHTEMHITQYLNNEAQIIKIVNITSILNISILIFSMSIFEKVYYSVHII